MTSGAAVAGLLLAGFLAACSSYYRVTDPASGTVYYTKDIDTNKAGAAMFTDARTKSKVTLQSSEVSKISEKEFKTAVGGD